MPQTHYRQGDVLILRVNSVPDGLKVEPRDNGRVILAYGEVTGHAHAILEPETDVRLLAGEDLNDRFLQVLAEGGVNLVHDEHSTIVLPAGDYRVVRQREYDIASGMVRLVAD